MLISTSTATGTSAATGASAATDHSAVAEHSTTAVADTPDHGAATFAEPYRAARNAAHTVSWLTNGMLTGITPQVYGRLRRVCVRCSQAVSVNAHCQKLHFV
jgi:hypothetical protein